MKQVPVFSENLFWDIETDDLDYELHFPFILARVVDYGTWEDWKELCKYYSKNQIKETAIKLRSISAKSLNFIAIYTNTPKEEFRCYKLRQSHPTLWNS